MSILGEFIKQNNSKRNKSADLLAQSQAHTFVFFPENLRCFLSIDKYNDYSNQLLKFINQQNHEIFFHEKKGIFCMPNHLIKPEWQLVNYNDHYYCWIFSCNDIDPSTRSTLNLNLNNFISELFKDDFDLLGIYNLIGYRDSDISHIIDIQLQGYYQHLISNSRDKIQFEEMPKETFFDKSLYEKKMNVMEFNTLYNKDFPDSMALLTKSPTFYSTHRSNNFFRQELMIIKFLIKAFNFSPESEIQLGTKVSPFDLKVKDDKNNSRKIFEFTQAAPTNDYQLASIFKQSGCYLSAQRAHSFHSEINKLGDYILQEVQKKHDKNYVIDQEYGAMILIVSIPYEYIHSGDMEQELPFIENILQYVKTKISLGNFRSIYLYTYHNTLHLIISSNDEDDNKICATNNMFVI